MTLCGQTYTIAKIIGYIRNYFYICSPFGKFHKGFIYN